MHKDNCIFNAFYYDDFLNSPQVANIASPRNLHRDAFSG